MDNFGQFREPLGESGRKTLEQMNEHHRDLAEWALSVIPKICPKKILDIGCGGGMAISLLAKKFNSHMYGIDISDESVRMTSEYNTELIRTGTLSVSKDSVSEMPFENGSFDLVTAIETYFFWPSLANDILEVGRVISVNGYVLIVSEVYPHPDFDERNGKMIETYGMNIVSNRKMAEMLENAGFEVETIEVEKNNWVAFLGRKLPPE